MKNSPTGHEKRRIALRYWLLGRGWHLAAEAMEYAEQHHPGVRKDRVTPAFAHQIGIASYCRTLAPHLRYPEETVAVAFLHDTPEDSGVSDSEIRGMFGNLVADAVAPLTKEFRGVRREDREVFREIGLNPIASVVKPADRINNQDSMVGVFTPAKIAEYLAETTEFVLPMVKKARKRFPDQEPAYENAKLVLTTQVRIVSGLLSAEDATSG